MIILRKYKSVVFWLIFVSLWIIGLCPCCNEKKKDEIKETENTSDNNVLNNINYNNGNINNYLELNQEQPILVGLKKIEEATCFMNATLQCLPNTKKLTKYLLEEYKGSNRDAVMTNAYYEVLRNLWNKNNPNKAYNPKSFAEKLIQENPLFAGIQANKSKDLIDFLLERFHQELNIEKPSNLLNSANGVYNQGQPDQTNRYSMLNLFLENFKKNFNSPSSNLFYGILETQIKCTVCNTIRYSFNDYKFLDFPLKKVNNYLCQNGRRNALVNQEGTNPDINLYECFDYYQKIELMTDGNKQFCNFCNALRDTYVTSFIYSTPRYLIINLDRGEEPIYKGNVFPHSQLNIGKYVSYKGCPTTYELYAVICQLKNSSRGDKIVAYCKNRIDNKWYLYNNEKVILCTDENKKDCLPGMYYILFYEECNPSYN